MRLIKIGVAAVDPTVGAVRSNADRVIELARALAAQDVTVGCFPEQVLGGYPPEDLVQWRAFIAEQRAQLERVAYATQDLSTVLVLGLVVGVDGLLYNAAAVVHRGVVLGFVPKEKLPTYNVFYEARTLARGGPGLALDADGVPLGDQIFAFDFGTLAVEVCEDIWTPDGPMRRRCYSGAELVVNISASPFRIGVAATRREMLATRSADNQAALAYANQIGSQDGLVFDGGGYIFQNGRLVLDAPRFQEGCWSCVLDLDRTRRQRRENSTWRTDCEMFQRREQAVGAVRAEGDTAAGRSRLRYPTPASGSFFLPSDEAAASSPRDELLDELLQAMALGVSDYYRKIGHFTGIGVALSGGRDSLLTLLVAWLALERLRTQAVATTAPGTDAEEPPSGRRRRGGTRGDDDAPQAPTLTAFYMPSRHSGAATRDAARLICQQLDVPLVEVSIDEAYDRELAATRAMLGNDEPSPITRQNIQARIRGARMWNWSNTAGALFLQTSDMSEKAVGYTTIGGDLEGALSPIANVPKTVVIALLLRLRQRYGFTAIDRTLETAAGPELAPDQTAVGELMPFEVLDACLNLFAGEKLSRDEVAAALPALFPDVEPHRLRRFAERFVQMFTRSIYKWVQSPLSLHVGTLDLERERALQLPVVQRTEWGEDSDD